MIQDEEAEIDVEANRFNSMRKCRELKQLSSRALSKSDPSKLYTDTTHEHARKLQSLNDNVLSYGRDRSYTFAVSSNNSKSRYSRNTNALDNTYPIEEYSPKVTKTITFDNPLEHFQQQYKQEATSGCGQVKVMFQYLNKSHEFHCKLLRVSNLVTESSSALGIYASVSLSPGRKYKKESKHKYNSSDPVFNEKFVYKISLDKLIESRLKIVFYNKPDRFSFSKQLGLCVIDLSKYDITTVTVMFEDIKKVNKFYLSY
jgi:hypothetical protein